MQNKNEIVIDAKNAIVGRLASFAAKQALLGKKVVIVNSEESVVTGNKKNVLKKYAMGRALGKGSQKGPHFPRKPEAMLRRAIRGMLPFDRARGREAFRNVKCYISVPHEFETVEKIAFARAKPVKSITLGEISKLI